MKQVLIFSLLFTFLQCKNNVEELKNDVGLNNLTPILIESADTGATMEKIFEFGQVIPLDSAESIGTASKIMFDDRCIIIADQKNTHKIYAYDLKGRLLGVISPAFFTEEKQLIGFNLNKERHEIELYDGYNIYRFDLHGGYLGAIETQSVGINTATLDENKHLVYATFFEAQDAEPYKIKWFDDRGKMLGKAWRQTTFSNFENGTIQNLCCSADQKALLLSQSFNDTIYSIDPNQVRRAFYVDFGSKKVKDPAVYQNKPLPEIYPLLRKEQACTGIDLLLDTRRILHFSFIRSDRMVSCFFDKKNAVAFIIDPSKRSPVWSCFPVSPIAVTQDDQFVFVLEPQEIIRAVRQGKFSQAELDSTFPALGAAIKNASDLSNPILVTGKLNL